MPSPSPRLRTALVCAALAAGTVLVFHAAAGHDFVDFDDGEYVFANPRVRQGLTLENVGWAFTSLEVMNWHPLTWLSHLADVSLFGVDPGAHHAVSVALHALNAAVLFLALLALTGATWPSAIAAALFAVHPLHVESVAWISERKDLLSFLFAALALVAYASYARSPSAGRYARVAALLALGLLAKPMLVTLPLVLLLLDVWPLGRVPLDAGAGPAARAAGRLLAEKVPLLALSAASSAITAVAQARGGAMVTVGLFPMGERIANAIVAYARYLGLTVWPAGLSPYVPYPVAPYPAVAVAGAALLLVALTAVALLRLRAQPYLAVGWLWFVGTLVPVIGLVQVGGQAMADRYTYLPLVGVFVAVAFLGRDVARALRAPVAAAAVAGLALAVLGAAAHRQVAVWRDTTTLFEHALAVDPDNWMAHTNLGKAALRAGRTEEAIARFREAARLWPASPLTLTNLGSALAIAGRRGEAAELFARAVAADPAHANAWYNLGVLHYEEGRLADARAALETAARLDPSDPRAAYFLGLVLLASGHVPDAAARLAGVVRVDPANAEARTALAIALAQSGRLDEAIEHFGEVVRLRPGDAGARENLEQALRERAARP